MPSPRSANWHAVSWVPSAIWVHTVLGPLLYVCRYTTVAAVASCQFTFQHSLRYRMAVMEEYAPLTTRASSRYFWTPISWLRSQKLPQATRPSLLASLARPWIHANDHCFPSLSRPLYCLLWNHGTRAIIFRGSYICLRAKGWTHMCMCAPKQSSSIILSARTPMSTDLIRSRTRRRRRRPLKLLPMSTLTNNIAKHNHTRLTKTNSGLDKFLSLNRQAKLGSWFKNLIR